MAARSELTHRLREFKLAAMGRMVPRVLSRKTSGVDGLAKKLAAKTPAAAPDASLESELLHPDDVPEILTGTHGTSSSLGAGSSGETGRLAGGQAGTDADGL